MGVDELEKHAQEKYEMKCGDQGSDFSFIDLERKKKTPHRVAWVGCRRGIEEGFYVFGRNTTRGK